MAWFNLKSSTPQKRNPDDSLVNGCDIEKVKPLPALLEEHRELMRTIYDCGVKLIIHDDALNWQKFYNMAYVNLALIAAYSFGADKKIWPYLTLICIFGIAAGILFRLTLREGIRCVEAHRCKIDLLEALFCVNAEKRFLFGGTVKNRREALRFGPMWSIIFWFTVLVITVVYVRPHQPPFDIAPVPTIQKPSAL